MQGSAHKLKSPTEKPHLSFGAQYIHTLKLPFFKKKMFIHMLCGKQPLGALGVGNLKRYHILDGRADVGMSDPCEAFFPPQFWKHPLIRMSRIRLCVDGPAPQ